MTGMASPPGQTLDTSLKKCQFCLQESNKIIIINCNTVYSSALSCTFADNAVCLHRREQEEPQPGSSGRGRSTWGLFHLPLSWEKWKMATDTAPKGRSKGGTLRYVSISCYKVLLASSHLARTFSGLLCMSTD